MKQINVALFTAASCSGKSEISRNYLKQPVLEGDGAFARIFDHFEKPEYKSEIGNMGCWEHLRKNPVFDKMFRQYHCDWFDKSDAPMSFVAEGWIYCHYEWRGQLRCAFKKNGRFQFNYCLFHLRLSYEDFFHRYKNAVKERYRDRDRHPFFDKTPEEQRVHCDKHFDKFLKSDLELPKKDEMDYQEFDNNKDLIDGISRFCQ